jgi:hypothetical protein
VEQDILPDSSIRSSRATLKRLDPDVLLLCLCGLGVFAVKKLFDSASVMEITPSTCLLLETGISVGRRAANAYRGARVSAVRTS